MAKPSTRDHRPGDPDIIAIGLAAFAHRKRQGEFLTYECGGYEYGIDLRQLDDHLLRYGVGVLIVSDVPTIVALRSLYPSLVMPAICVWASDPTMERRLEKAGWSEREIRRRLSRSAPMRVAFQEHPEVFDAVIVNEFDRATLERQVRAVAARCTRRGAIRCCEGGV